MGGRRRGEPGLAIPPPPTDLGWVRGGAQLAPVRPSVRGRLLLLLRQRRPGSCVRLSVRPSVRACARRASSRSAPGALGTPPAGRPPWGASKRASEEEGARARPPPLTRTSLSSPARRACLAPVPVWALPSFLPSVPGHRPKCRQGADLPARSLAPSLARFLAPVGRVAGESAEGGNRRHKNRLYL